MANLQNPSQKWVKCILDVNTHLPLALGALYTKKHLNEDSKKNVNGIIDSLKKSVMHLLEKVLYIKLHCHFIHE